MYQIKSGQVDVVQFKDRNWDEIATFANQDVAFENGVLIVGEDLILTEYDYLLKDSNGKLSTIDSSTFHAIYEEIPVEVKKA